MNINSLKDRERPESAAAIKSASLRSDVMKILFLGLALALAGCAHRGATLAGEGKPAPAAPAGLSAREELLKSLGKKDPAPDKTPAPAQAKVKAKAASADDDDFIDVDDKKGFKKSWPMAMFIALLAVGIGVL
jgi:hypothetical protein